MHCSSGTMQGLRLASLAGVLLAASPSGRGLEPPATLTIHVRNVRNGSGQVLCALHSRPESMANPDLAFRRARGEIVHGAAVCVFEDVPVGDYVVAVVHDENGNSRLDTNFLGIPREGVGVSNDARGFLGPPRFEDARFHFDGRVAPLIVHLVYL